VTSPKVRPDSSKIRTTIEKMSTLGEILKMLPGAPVDDLVLMEALAKVEPNQRLGESLLAMRVITVDQLTRALDLQKKMREMHDLDEVMCFFEEVKAAAERARSTLSQSALFAAVPTSNHGS